MPIRQRNNKWYWGSKGPFDSRKKAEKVAHAVHASGYVAQFLEFTKADEGIKGIKGIGDTSSDRPEDDVPKQFREYASLEEIKRLGLRPHTGIKEGTFYDSRDLKNASPVSATPENQERAKRFEEENKGLPKEEALTFKSPLGKYLVKTQELDAMANNYDHVSNALILIHDAHNGVDSDDVAHAYDYFMDIAFKKGHSGEAMEKRIKPEKLQQFIDEVQRMANYTTRDLPEFVTVYRGNKSEWEKGDPKADEASVKTAERRYSTGQTVPVTVQKHTAKEFATSAGNRRGHLHEFLIHRNDIISDMRSSILKEGELLISSDTWKKIIKHPSYKVNVVDPQDGTHDQFFSRWPHRDKHRAKMNPASPHYSDSYAKQQHHFQRMYLDSLKDPKHSFHKLTGEYQDVQDMITETAKLDIKESEKYPWLKAPPKTTEEEKSMDLSKSDVSKFVDFMKQKPPGFNPVLSPLEGLGEGGKQAGQDIPPERRIYLDEGETAPTGTSGSPVPTYVGPKGGSFYDKNLIGQAGEDFKDFHDAVRELRDLQEERGESELIQDIHDLSKKVDNYEAEYDNPINWDEIQKKHNDLSQEVHKADRERIKERADEEDEADKIDDLKERIDKKNEIQMRYESEHKARVEADPEGIHARYEAARKEWKDGLDQISNAKQEARDNDPELQKLIKQHKEAEEKHKAFDDAERKVGNALLSSIKKNGLDLDGERVDIDPNLEIGSRSDWYALLKNTYNITPPKDMHWSKDAVADFIAASKNVTLGGRFMDKHELTGRDGIGVADHLFPEGKVHGLEHEEGDPSLFVMAPYHMDDILKLKPHTDGGKNLSPQERYEHQRGLTAMHTVLHEAMHSYNHGVRHRGQSNLIDQLVKESGEDGIGGNSDARKQMSHNLHMFLEESTTELLSSHFIAKRYHKDNIPENSSQHAERMKDRKSPYLNAERYNGLSHSYNAYTPHVAKWAMQESGGNPAKARKLILRLKNATADMGLEEGNEKREEAFKFLSDKINSYGTYLSGAKDIKDPLRRNIGKASKYQKASEKYVELMIGFRQFRKPSVKTQGFGLKQTDWKGRHSGDHYKNATGRHERSGYGYSVFNPFKRMQSAKDSHMDIMDLIFGADTEAAVTKSFWKEDGGGGFGGDAGAGTVFTSTDSGVFTPTYGESSAKRRTRVLRDKRKKKTGVERLGAWLTDFSPEKKSISKSTPTDFALDVLVNVVKEYKMKDPKLRNKVDTKLPENETVTNYRPKILDWKKRDDDNAGALTYAKALDTESSGEEGKIKQEQAGFRQATAFEKSKDVQCGSCIFFKEDDNECQLVTGNIEEDTWCNLYNSENKPKPDENEMVEGEDIQKARDLEDYFSNKYPMQSDKLKRRIIREAVFPRECAGCKCSEWKGSVVPLELDHIDGDHGNNAKENLRLICPNCHALTPTYRVKKPGAKSAIDLHGGAPKGDPRRDKSLDKDLRKEASEGKNPKEWGTPTKHHTDVLNRKYNVLTKKPEAYLDSLDAPHDNKLEIETIKHYQEDASRVEKDIKAEDKDNVKPFLDYLKENKLPIDENYLNGINKDVNTIVHHVKFKFNRPRPSQVSEIEPTPNDGGYSPSYPSGHTVQSTVMAGVLSKIYPEHSEDFSKIADKIGQNRIRAGLHYPSDHRAGQALGMEILDDVPSDTEQHLKKRLTVMLDEEREVGASQQVKFHDPKYVETESPLKENPNSAVLEQNEFMERLRATTAKHVGDKKDDSDEKAQAMAADAQFGPEIRLSKTFEDNPKLLKLAQEDESFRRIAQNIFEEPDRT